MHSGRTEVACGSNSALVYSVATGRISPRGNGWRPVRHCSATGLERHGRPGDGAQKVRGYPEQFQYNPSTGALRPKARSCIAASQGESTRVADRDCCIVLCPTFKPPAGWST